MLYEHMTIRTAGLPFAELKQKAHINPAARAANDSPDFSKLIRAGVSGMETKLPAFYCMGRGE